MKKINIISLVLNKNVATKILATVINSISRLLKISSVQPRLKIHQRTTLMICIVTRHATMIFVLKYQYWSVLVKVMQRLLYTCTM